MFVYPAPTRSLRNTIARHLHEGCSCDFITLRRHLEDAQQAIDACGSYLLVHGPAHLLDQVAGAS